jgi:hypothetical protein
MRGYHASSAAMAVVSLSPVPADRDVQHRSSLFVHPAAPVADRDDAWRLGALAEYDGYERRHRDPDCRADLAGRHRAHPPRARAEYGSGSGQDIYSNW